MMITELTGIAGSALPRAAFASHLRLPEDFAAVPGQEARLDAAVLAAIGAVEARTGKVLIARTHLARLEAWPEDGAVTFSIGPVSAVSSVKVIARDGTESVLPAESYTLVPEAHRPKIVARGGFPALANGATAEIILTAGYGAVWEDVPAPLRQAVFLLAETFFEHGGTRSGAALPEAVRLLLEPYRLVRLGLGGVAR